MSTQSKRVAFHTMGCKLNFSETSTIKRDFLSRGFTDVNFSDIADIYVLNTCSVTENANKEARKLIRQAKRKNPFSSIVAIGCYAQLNPDEISQTDGVDLVLGAEQKFDILDHLDLIDIDQRSKKVHSTINKAKNFIPSFSLNDRTRSYLKIQDGCNYKCTFCTIPLARGFSRSNSIDKTVSLAKKVEEAGAKEIVLTGVNIGDFGKKQKESFLDLIRSLDKLTKIERFRISSIEPNLLSTDIIDFCNESDKFMPHFHIPLQSGSNKILRLMKRRYDTELYQRRIEYIKSLMPDTCLGVDVIVGFPGETDSDFNDTYQFLQSIDVSYFHVFTYSERSNTLAANYKNKVPMKIRSKRSKELHRLSDIKKSFFHNSYLGTSRNVLFEHSFNGEAFGHTDNYIPISVKTSTDLKNKIKKINISNKGRKSLEGKFIS